jgi:hypothetical protein
MVFRAHIRNRKLKNYRVPRILQHPWSTHERSLKYYTIGIPMGLQLIYYGDIYGPSSTLLWGYLWILKYYTMGVSMAPPALYYGNTYVSSSTILWEHLCVLKCYTMWIPMGPQVLYYGDTYVSSSTVLWVCLCVLGCHTMEYLWVLKYYGLPMSPQIL